MNKYRVNTALTRTLRVGATATFLLSAGLMVTVPPKAFAQEMAADSAPRDEAIPAISIVKPASGKTYTVAITGANGYVHPQPGGAGISNVTVLIHRDSGGSSKGYLDGSGHFQDVSQENSGSYYRAAYVDNAKGTWSVNIDLPADDFQGDYTLKALAVDSAGKQNFATAGFSITDNNHTISGSVKTRDNKGVSGVPVGARPRDGDNWQTATTDDQGSYTLPNLTAGSWVVTVRDRISDPHSTTVTLTESSRYASASFFVADSQPLVHEGVSQKASDAFRRTGISPDRITQTYGFADASKGAHDLSGYENGEPYSNAIDISLPGNPDDIAKEIHALRMAGFAAWRRTREEFPKAGPHYHIVYAGSPSNNISQNQQIRSFQERDAGLASSHWEAVNPITQDEIDAVVNLYESVNGANALEKYDTYENGYEQRHQ